MNRYDWLIWAFRIVVSGDVINKARSLIEELESASGDGAKKREMVENILLPSITSGSIYIARALVELLLGSIRSSHD